MKPETPPREAELIQDAVTVAPSSIRSPLPCQAASPHLEPGTWLTAEHRAVLATLAHWLGDVEEGESRRPPEHPRQRKQEITK